METERKLRIERYRIEPYFPRIVERENEPSVHYMLSVPRPLDREQMELILSVISQMRRPSGYYTDGIMLDVLRRKE